MTPFFSVITVHYNQLEALKLTVNKMREQQGMGVLFEHLVIDGGSADGTATYLSSLRGHAGFRYISEKDHGIYDAMNKGVSIAAGQYVFFINAGDYFATRTVLTELKVQLKGETAVYGDTLVHYGDFKRTAKARPGDAWKHMPFVHQSLCTRKDVLLKHPFDLRYNYCADYEQFAAISKTHGEMKYCAMPFSAVQAGGASDTGRVKAIKEVAEISRRYFNSTFSRRWYFRKEIIKARFVLLLKKMLPTTWTRKLTRLKYSGK